MAASDTWRVNVSADTKELRDAVDDAERSLRRLQVLMPVSESGRLLRVMIGAGAGILIVLVASLLALAIYRYQLLRELIVDRNVQPQVARCAVYGDEGTFASRTPPCDALIAKAAAIFVPSGSQVLIPAAPAAPVEGGK